VGVEIPDFTETERRVVETALRERHRESMAIKQLDPERILGFVPGARFAAQ
jgi:hypothetical protein